MQSWLLGRIQQRVEMFLTDSCLIESETDSMGDFGEPLHTWQSVASNVPCRLIRQSMDQGGAQVVGSQEALIETYKLIVPGDTALDADQRVTVGGEVYQIVQVVMTLTDTVTRTAIMTRVRP